MLEAGHEPAAEAARPQTVTVRRAVEGTKAKGLTLKSPKTTKSRRTIALLPLAVSALAAQPERRVAEKPLPGPGYADQGFVFAGPTGRLLDPERATKAIARLCTKAKMLRIRWHDLRHSHASMLLKAVVCVRVVADRLRHLTTRLTMEWKRTRKSSAAWTRRRPRSSRRPRGGATK